MSQIKYFVLIAGVLFSFEVRGQTGKYEETDNNQFHILDALVPKFALKLKKDCECIFDQNAYRPTPGSVPSEPDSDGKCYQEFQVRRCDNGGGVEGNDVCNPIILNIPPLMVPLKITGLWDGDWEQGPRREVPCPSPAAQQTQSVQVGQE